MKYSAALPMFQHAVFFFARSEGQRDVIFHEKKCSQNSASLVQKIICLIFNN